MNNSPENEESLLSQYGDLREDDEAILPASQDSEPTIVDHDTSEAMEDVLEGTWFTANGKKKRTRDGGSNDTSPGPTVSNKKPRGSLPALPTNKTLASQGAQKTILVSQPFEDQENYHGSSTRRLCMDPIAVARGLKSIIDFSKVKDVRVNKRRNIVAVEFLSAEECGNSSLLGVTHIDKYATTCYQPSMDHGEVTWGVIYDIGLEHDMDELLKSISCEGHSILKVARLHRFADGTRNPSTSVKVGFSGKVLPTVLRINYIQFRISPYSEPPLRCYRCQRHGHLSSGCTAQIRCLVCGQQHYKENCTANTPTCANCKGNHMANSKLCPYTQDSKKIKELTRSGMPHRQARQQVLRPHTKQLVTQTPSVPAETQKRTRNRSAPAPRPQRNSSTPANSNQLQVHVAEAEVHNTQGSYYPSDRNARRPATSYVDAVSQKIAESQESQAAPVSFSRSHQSRNLDSQQISRSQRNTTQPPSLNFPRDNSKLPLPTEEKLISRCQAHFDTLLENLFEKLAKFLLEVFTTNLSLENKRERELILLGMVRNHFGRRLGESLLGEFQASTDSSLPTKPAAHSAGRTRSDITPKNTRIPKPAKSNLNSRNDF